MGLLADVKGFVKMFYEIGSPRIFWIAFTRIALPQFLRTLWYWNTVQERVLHFVKKTAKEGDPASVLDALDVYYTDHEAILSFAPEKRRKVEEVARKASPKVCLEMGTYVGVSAITVARYIPPGGRLITTELLAHNAQVAQEMVRFAGLDQVVTVVNERAEDIIKDLRGKYSVDKLDFVLLDHNKWLYVPDLKALEKEGLLHKGTTIVADDCLWPCAPDYLKYVENDPRYQTERFYTVALPGVFDEPDVVAISTYKGDV